MPRTIFALLLLCAACTNVPTDPYYNRAGSDAVIERTEIAVSTQVAAAPITQSAQEAERVYHITETFIPPSLTGTAIANAAAQVVATQVSDDATAQASFRATENLRMSVVMSTAIPATGTALALNHAQEVADTRTAEAVSNLAWALGGLFGLAALVAVGIGGYWLWGRAKANVAKANTAAENNKPQVFEDVLVYPSPSGQGYIHQRLLRAPAPLPALSPPTEIAEREIGGQLNGRPHSITKSEPVNLHEKAWREFLVLFLLYARDHDTFASPDLAGAGKPLSSNDHWMRATKVLADNNLILKDNGDKTVRAGEWSDLIARVQDATHPLKLPERLPPHFRVFEAQKVL